MGLCSDADFTYLLAYHYSSCTYVNMNTENRFSAELCYGRQRSECFVEDLREKACNKVKHFKLITLTNDASVHKV